MASRMWRQNARPAHVWRVIHGFRVACAIIAGFSPEHIPLTFARLPFVMLNGPADDMRVNVHVPAQSFSDPFGRNRNLPGLTQVLKDSPIRLPMPFAGARFGGTP